MSLFLSTTREPETFTVDNVASSPRYSQLWEVVVVAASPVVLVFLLCFCVVCLVFKRQERAVPSAPNLPSTSTTSRRTPLANILRQLPPPPKYDVAIASSPPPPLYSDAAKELPYDPLLSFQARRSAPSSPGSPDSSQLSIQYLYPPRYDTEQRQSTAIDMSSNAEPPTYSLPSSSASLTLSSTPSTSSDSLDMAMCHQIILDHQRDLEAGRQEAEVEEEEVEGRSSPPPSTSRAHVIDLSSLDNGQAITTERQHL